MKTLTFFLLFLCITFFSWSQEQALKITNQETQKEIIIKNNKRVKIVTSEGQKIKGRLAIVDKTTIFVNKQPLALSDIYQIKRNPLLTSIFIVSFGLRRGPSNRFWSPHWSFSRFLCFLAHPPGICYDLYGSQSPELLSKIFKGQELEFGDSIPLPLKNNIPCRHSK